MSWDVMLGLPLKTMGSKEQAREAFLYACERIIGADIRRRGPTAISIDPSFQFEVSFTGHKSAVESISLGIQIIEGDPHQDLEHPVWSLLKQLQRHTGWDVIDTYTATAIKLDE